MNYKDLITSASEIVNDVLGVRCDYENKDGTFTHGIMIAINKNREVKGDFGIIAGNYIEASILKSDIEKVRAGDKFTDDEGQEYKIESLVKVGTAKFYAAIIEIF